MTNILEATSFGATSTTDDVLSGVNLKGKRILVTGISAGIGMETARSLAAHGAQVVGAARDLNKAEAATEQVRKDAAANGGSFELVELDLANLKSVLACADRLLAKGEPLDVVIANAGVFLTIPAQTLKSPVRSLPVRSSPHLLTTLSPRPLSPSGKDSLPFRRAQCARVASLKSSSRRGGRKCKPLRRPVPIYRETHWF